MKLCFSTVACDGFSISDIITHAAKNNITAVEVRLDTENKLFGADPYTPELLREVVSQFENAKIAITVLGTSTIINTYREEEVLQIKKSIDLADAAGAFGIRIFLGNFARKYCDIKPYDYDGIVKALSESAQYAKEKNVRILIETHNQFATGKILKKLYDDIGSDAIGIIWDIVHPIEDNESFPETWDYIGDIIYHVHIKDGNKPQDSEMHDYTYTRLGEGELPIREILSHLEKNSYSGYVSLEWENKWRAELKEYPNDLDWILGEFTAFVKDYTNLKGDKNNGK